MSHSNADFIVNGKGPRLLPGVVVADVHGIIRSVNEEVCRVFGFSSGELVGFSITKLMPKTIGDQHPAILKRYFSQGGAFRGTTMRVVHGLRKDGREVKIRLALSLIPSDQEPLISGMIDEIVDHSFTLTSDCVGKVISVSGNTWETCGYTHVELMGQNVAIFCPQSIARSHTSMMKHFRAGDESVVVGQTRNRELRHKLGHLLPVSLEILSIRGGDTAAVFQAKVTEIELAMEGMVVANTEGIIQSVDPVAALLLGYESNEMTNQSCATFFPRLEFKEGNRMILATHRDGSQFFVSLSMEYVLVDQAVIGYRGVIRRVPPNRVNRQRSSRLRMDQDDHPSAELLAGRTLEWYSITDRILGRGCSGDVRMGVHRLTGLQVALKILTKNQMMRDQMEYPPRELALLTKIDHHPHIVRLFHAVVLEHAVVLVMEFVQGGELLDFVSQQDHLSEDLARRFMRQIVPAVEFLHNLGIVHRDLKLENILLDAHGNTKIIDLGFGNSYGRNGLLKTFCGSPDYASPELWEGEPYLGPEVDVWALGVILYIMITGFIPFNEAAQVIAMRYHWPPQFDISAQLQGLLRRVFCTAKTRCSATDMREDPWMTEDGNRPCNATPLRPVDAVVVPNDVIIARMEEMGFPKRSVLRAIQAREHNQLSTTYAMLEHQFDLHERERRRVSLNNSSTRSSCPSPSDGSPRYRNKNSNEKCILC